MKFSRRHGAAIPSADAPSASGRPDTPDPTQTDPSVKSPSGGDPTSRESEASAPKGKPELSPVLDIPSVAPAAGRDSEELATPPQPAPTSEELAAEYLDQLQRLKAEFDNYRRRVQREREEWFVTARAEVVRQLLPVLDDLRRARVHQQSSKEDVDAAGLLLIMKRFEDVLTQQGLKEQEAPAGTEFDPERHEAVMSAASEEVPEGLILQVIEPGYLFQDRMLRAGKVTVSSGPATE